MFIKEEIKHEKEHKGKEIQMDKMPARRQTFTKSKRFV